MNCEQIITFTNSTYKPHFLLLKAVSLHTAGIFGEGQKCTSVFLFTQIPLMPLLGSFLWWFFDSCHI